MLVILPDITIIIIDFVLWFTIHFSVAYLGTNIEIKYYNTDYWIYKKYNWERNGRIYESLFKIKLWKEWLPDGSALFKNGFKKKRMQSFSPDYIKMFIQETCRAEIIHWIVILFSPIFFIWNYTWAGIIIIIYALIANIPCILAQRYNRLRLLNLLNKNYNIKVL